MFDRAKKAIAEVPVHEETIRVWKKAMEQVGQVDEKRVVALEVAEDGNVKFEVVPLTDERAGLGQDTGFVLDDNKTDGEEPP